jgi:3'-phosphoadenosine 5'-phosphosulfate sulfotransferase (PAPS reductase)/FAD synthetase
LPLEFKIKKSKEKIKEWIDFYGKEKVYVSFSGGKDSTVLLNLVRQIEPSILAVYADTGLEYPSIKDFVKSFDNIKIIRPKMSFRQVINKYGYPIVSKESASNIYYARRALKLGD